MHRWKLSCPAVFAAMARRASASVIGNSLAESVVFLDGCGYVRTPSQPGRDGLSPCTKLYYIRPTLSSASVVSPHHRSESEWRVQSPESGVVGADVAGQAQRRPDLRRQGGGGVGPVDPG